jgi:poly-gamma-glutamate capsule biosynthesis protein CapA/YwtB (metallophosphatase superfamily)
MSDADRGSLRSARTERQRAARRTRTRRTLIVCASVTGAVLLAGAAYAAWSVLDSARAPRNALAAPAVPSVSETPAIALVTLGAAAEAARDETLTIIAVGDLLFDLSPRTLIAKQGGAAPLAKVADLLKDADITIGNLECPLSARGVKVAGKPDHLIFRAPPNAVESLTTAGVDIVALANNHMMDYGAPAMEDTLRTLDTAGVAHAGGGMNKADAWKPAIVEREGKKVAYLSFTQRIPSYFMPTASTPGIASGKDMRAVIAAIRSAKTQADYVIVSFHWGVEQAYEVNAGQVRDGRAAIDAGADMVLSHHPHVMQGVEFYKGKLIAYSLGNFLFPYKTVEGRKSIILKASLGPGGVTDVTAVPVYLGEWGRPSVQTGRSAAGILGKLKAISAPRGTTVIIEGDRARIVPE